MDATHWLERLGSELADLGQQEFLIIGEPEPDPPPAPEGFLAKLRSKASKSVEPSRWGQVLCVDEVLFAEFVGTQLIGGLWEAPVDQHEALRAAGWLTPDETGPIGQAPPLPHYWRTVPQPEAELVAGLLVDAFRILGADFETLWLKRDR